MLEGWKKGDEKMMTYGIERAFDKERDMAKREGKNEEKKAIALKLLSMQMDIDKIVEATGLTQEEIKALTLKQ